MVFNASYFLSCKKRATRHQSLWKDITFIFALLLLLLLLRMQLIARFDFDWRASNRCQLVWWPATQVSIERVVATDFEGNKTFWKSCIERVESTDFEGKKNILKIMYQTSCIDWIWVGKTDLSKNIANNLKWYERAVVQKKNAFN
jgi:hypothetical protein